MNFYVGHFYEFKRHIEMILNYKMFIYFCVNEGTDENMSVATIHL